MEKVAFFVAVFYNFVTAVLFEFTNKPGADDFTSNICLSG